MSIFDGPIIARAIEKAEEKSIKAWKAKDGQLFESLLEVGEHDAKQALTKWLEEHLQTHGMNHHIVPAILKNRRSLLKILNDLEKYTK